jgi:hypothetical protein
MNETLVRNCVQCGRRVEIVCTKQQLANWQRGQLIQVALSNVPAEDREMLITGICGLCWKKMFAKENDERNRVDYF